jgi:hypothetical protein
MSDDTTRFVLVGTCMLCGEVIRSTNPRKEGDARKVLLQMLREPKLHASDAGCFGILEMQGLELFSEHE